MPYTQNGQEASPADVDIFEIHAAFCGIFSSPIRLRIMWFLGSEERRVGELVRALDLAIPNISQHLRIMRDQGAVQTRREGRTIYYRLANTKFLQGARLIREGLIEELRKRGALAAGPENPEEASFRAEEA